MKMLQTSRLVNYRPVWIIQTDHVTNLMTQTLYLCLNLQTFDTMLLWCFPLICKLNVLVRSFSELFISVLTIILSTGDQRMWLIMCFHWFCEETGADVTYLLRVLNISFLPLPSLVKKWPFGNFGICISASALASESASASAFKYIHRLLRTINHFQSWKLVVYI